MHSTSEVSGIPDIRCQCKPDANGSSLSLNLTRSAPTPSLPVIKFTGEVLDVTATEATLWLPYSLTTLSPLLIRVTNACLFSVLW